MDIDKKEVLRYLGHKNQKIDKELDDLINLSINELSDIVRPLYTYKTFDLEITDGKNIKVLGTNLVFKGQDIYKHLKDAKRCSIMAATLGIIIDNKIRITGKTNMTKSIIYDAIATEMIEKTADKVEEEIVELAKQQSFKTNFRYSPGYGDFPMDIQGDIISVLNANKAIGLTVTSSHILIPRKSVTAVVGFLNQDSKAVKKTHVIIVIEVKLVDLEGMVEVVKVEELKQGEFLLFDAAMGTMLQSAGLKTGELPETYNITNPDIVRDIHKKCVDAGSDVVSTNTFQANELKLADSKYSVEEIIDSGVKLAKQSGAKYVALDMGPLGQLMEPMGTISFEQAYDIYKRQVIAGSKAGADIILIETVADIYEAKAAVLAAKENCDLPVFCTLTYQEDGRTFVGTDPVTSTIVLDGLGVDAHGVNCSLGPKELKPIIDQVLEYAKSPVMIQANAGLPKIVDGETVYDISPKKFTEHLKLIAQGGAVVFGGCCGTTPEFIRHIRKMLDEITPFKTNPKKVTAASSGSKTIILDNVTTVIGEKINPTGKKKLQQALRTNNMEYILGEAIDQANAGADMLDINVGLPELDEAEMIKRVIKEVQGVVNLPIQVDSSDIDAIEAGVRVCNGKPMINSVNGTQESMSKIFPIVKKYGALILGLALDEQGIPETAEGRLEVARKIVETANQYGIPKEDVLIDCLVLTASAQQEQVKETLKAIRLVKQELGVKTVLGVSNVSFGLPNRELINSNFLAASFGAGLDAPIINPMSKPIMDTVYAYRVINNEDKDSMYFIENYSDSQTNRSKEESSGEERTLRDIIIQGRKEESAAKTTEMLKTVTTMEVVNNHFIPALDTVGDRFESGAIFLPQLIQSAEAVKNAFAIIKDHISQSGEEERSKGKIVLATVQGDIHDIGKNIASMLLENYGFDVIDLGKDVAIETVVETVKQNNVKLVGLSALMTTTVTSMGETIKALRDQGLDCKVMVGGAVLNEKYTAMVDADFYAKDAREGVKIANEFFGVNE